MSVFGCEKSIVKWKHLLYDVEQLIQIVSTKEVFPMSILTQVCDKMQKLLTHTADEAARHCGLVQRHRKLTGSALVQTLVFGWFANPEASYDELAQTAGTLGIAVSRQAIEQRLTPEAAETLKATLESAAQEAIASTRVYSRSSTGSPVSTYKTALGYRFRMCFMTHAGVPETGRTPIKPL